MEENKVLTEEEEKQVSGGTSAEVAAQPMRIFCPKCNSSDITAKSFAYNGNHQMTALLHCNSCGNEWKTLAKKLGPGYGQNSN